MSSLIGDKAYPSDGFRAEIVNRGAGQILPAKMIGGRRVFAGGGDD
jgi:hypothetical protein